MLEEKMERIAIALEALVEKLGQPVVVAQPVEEKPKKASAKKTEKPAETPQVPTVPVDVPPAIPDNVTPPAAGAVTIEQLQAALMQVFQSGPDGNTQALSIIKTCGGANSIKEIPVEKIALCMAEAQKILKGA